jgi:hypothetical protein
VNSVNPKGRRRDGVSEEEIGAFERLWESITEQAEEDADARCRGFFGVFRAGGAEKEDLKRHMAKLCAALCRTGYYDTLAVMFRGLGLSDKEILELIQGELIDSHRSVDSAWNALQVATLEVDDREVVATLKKVSDSYRGFYGRHEGAILFD